MKKPLILYLFTFLFLFSAVAQTSLLVKSGDKGLYLDHTVVAKEGWYSVGRMYNVSPRFLSLYNNIDVNKGLNIGQVIRIPLSDTNFNQKSSKGTPVYYQVGPNDVLSKISATHGKVSLQNLRSWNGMKNDNVQSGKKMIVGFLVSNEMHDLAIRDAANVPAKQTEEKAVVKAAPVVEKPVVSSETQQVKEEPKAITPVPAKKEAVKNATVLETGPLTDAGYFRSSFEQQSKSNPPSKNKTFTSGIFKTTSGWQDGKYYLLVDAVPTGTIVRITSPESNKTVYAKVLGEMNGIRQNQGLDIRISNAAASALGIGDTEKFTVQMNY